MERLDSLCKEIRTTVACTATVRIGVPYEEILNEAEKVGPDLIVLGGKGVSALARMVLAPRLRKSSGLRNVQCWWPAFLQTNHRRACAILTSVPSPKSLELRRRSVGCFSRRERSAHIFVIRVERATRKNSQLAAARRVALKMGRLLRCSSVTYRSRYAPSSRLADDPF